MRELWKRSGYTKEIPVRTNADNREEFNASVIKTAKIADRRRQGRWFRRINKPGYLLIAKDEVNYPFSIARLKIGDKDSYDLNYVGELPQDNTKVVGLRTSISLRLTFHRFTVFPEQTIPADNYDKAVGRVKK